MYKKYEIWVLWSRGNLKNNETCLGIKESKTIGNQRFPSYYDQHFAIIAWDGIFGGSSMEKSSSWVCYSILNY